MARPETEYQKLPGRGRPPFPASLAGGASRLYLGKDHLLKVESSYWTERYRRYYFKDIRLLQITKTRSALVTLIVLLVITLFFGAIAAWVDETPRIVLGIVAASFAVIAFIRWALGPSCRVKITTPLGADDLFSLSRLRVAKKVVDRIVPYIRQAQENVDPTTLAGRVSAEIPSTESAVTLPKIQSPTPSAEVPTGKIWVAWTFAIILFLHCGLSLWQVVAPANWVLPTALTLLAVAFGFDVALLTRPAPGCPRKITTSFIAYLGLYGVFLYVIMVQLMITDPEKMTNQSNIYPALLAQASKANGFNLFLHLFTTVVSGIFALLVAVLLSRTRFEKIEVEAVQSPTIPPSP